MRNTVGNVHLFLGVTQRFRLCAVARFRGCALCGPWCIACVVGSFFYITLSYRVINLQVDLFVRVLIRIRDLPSSVHAFF
jgi:hypothetical protein